MFMQLSLHVLHAARMADSADGEKDRLEASTKLLFDIIQLHRGYFQQFHAEHRPGGLLLCNSHV